MPGLRPLRIGPFNRGCVDTVVFENMDEKCNPIPLSGKLYLTAKNVPWDDVADDSDAIFKEEGVISEDEQWRVTFSLTESDTYQDPEEEYFFDIVMTDSEGDNARRLALGEFRIIGGANNAQAGGDE